MAIEVLDPTNEDAPEAVTLAPRLRDLQGKTVGLLSNGKAGTARLFDHMEEILRHDYGVAEVVRRTKRNYSAPAEPELMNEASTWAAMFAGTGD
ncbi:MAG: hypothetical protein QOJ19_1074 [Acidimicrobiia bacterium]|jgi:hypothetical protein|nr:hypothetical protein [Acidimicrobiia bacterium]